MTPTPIDDARAFLARYPLSSRPTAWEREADSVLRTLIGYAQACECYAGIDDASLADVGILPRESRELAIVA